MRTPIVITATLLALVSSFPVNSFGAEKTIRCRLADGFDFPVGIPDARGYYKARGFWPRSHVGEDWNGTGGGNTDLGDPIYSIGHGVVTFSRDCGGGWGNVVIIRHAFRDLDGQIRMVDSLYGHLEKRLVQKHQTVTRNEVIGTLGRGAKQKNGRYLYLAHLHFEIRKNLQIGMHRNKYKWDYSNYYSPTKFIGDRRDLRTGLSARYSIPVDNYEPYKGRSTGPNIASSGKTDNRISLPLLKDYEPPVVKRPPEALPEADRIILEAKMPPEKPDFWKQLRENLAKQ